MESDAANETPSVRHSHREKGGLLLQRIPQIVEFRYECLDAKGKPITVPERCGGVSPPEVAGNEREPEHTACDSVEAPSVSKATGVIQLGHTPSTHAGGEGEDVKIIQKAERDSRERRRRVSIDECVHSRRLPPWLLAAHALS